MPLSVVDLKLNNTQTSRQNFVNDVRYEKRDGLQRTDTQFPWNEVTIYTLNDLVNVGIKKDRCT
jgi:hypothetical protein